jgi:hypothetical protein
MRWPELIRWIVANAWWWRLQRAVGTSPALLNNMPRAAPKNDTAPTSIPRSSVGLVVEGQSPVSFFLRNNRN